MPALRRFAPADRGIVEHKTDRHQQRAEQGAVIDHSNLRGPNYFH
jgi:hypothetical protein